MSPATELDRELIEAELNQGIVDSGQDPRLRLPWAEITRRKIKGYRGRVWCDGGVSTFFCFFCFFHWGCGEGLLVEKGKEKMGTQSGKMVPTCSSGRMEMIIRWCCRMEVV